MGAGRCQPLAKDNGVHREVDSEGSRRQNSAPRNTNIISHTIGMIAELINPTVRGLLNYFMKYCPSAVKYNMDCLNRCLVKWVMCKYKRFRGHRNRAEEWISAVAKKRVQRVFTLGSRLVALIWFNDKSRMNREVHVRLRENLTVKLRWAT